jgi:hypothetical protein
MSEKRPGKKVHAYTPGLQVKKNAIVRKTRILPLRGEVLVKKGDYVNFDTIVARAFAPGDPEIINAAAKLGVAKVSLPLYMQKKIGDEVSEGEIIAKNIIFFGLLKRRIYAPFNGTIEHISDISGRVIVRGALIPVEVAAYIPGQVIEVMPDQGVTVETAASFIQGIFGIGGESYGEIHMAVESGDEPLTPDTISLEHKGKILVGGSYVTADAMKKAAELGVVGIVSGGIGSSGLKEFLGYEIGVAITGEEDCGITVVATESFGEMPMAEHTFNMLKELEGKTASITGATQIRAGVLRPEIIVPAPKAAAASGSEAERDVGMMPGTRVRAIRAPYFGKLGFVRSLPPGLQRLETESMARVVEVEFDDGTRAITPRANVEIIVE